MIWQNLNGGLDTLLSIPMIAQKKIDKFFHIWSYYNYVRIVSVLIFAFPIVAAALFGATAPPSTINPPSSTASM